MKIRYAHRKFALACSVIVLGGCRIFAPAQHPAAESPVEPTPPSGQHQEICRCGDSDVDELLSYHHAVRQMNPAEISKTLAGLNRPNPTARVLVQKAMLLANLHGSGDLQRAQTLLEQVLSSTKADAERLKPLAGLLNSTYGEWRRLDDNADKLAQQVRDEQRRTEQLNDKLEALKNIERSLQTRPQAPAAPGASDAGKR